MVLVYVDDFLFLRPTEVVEKAVKAVSDTWTCSTPTFVSNGLIQQAYEQELLDRWPQEKSSPQIQLRVPSMQRTKTMRAIVDGSFTMVERSMSS